MKTIWIQWNFIKQNVHNYINQIIFDVNIHLNIVEIELFPCTHFLVLFCTVYNMQLCIWSQSARPVHSRLFNPKSVNSPSPTSQVCVLLCTILQAAIFYFSLLISDLINLPPAASPVYHLCCVLVILYTQFALGNMSQLELSPILNSINMQSINVVSYGGFKLLVVVLFNSRSLICLGLATFSWRKTNITSFHKFDNQNLLILLYTLLLFMQISTYYFNPSTNVPADASV